MNKAITLLVIDRDEEYAKSLSSFAKNHSAFLDSAHTSDSRAVFDIIEIIKPTVIITDFLMPGLDIIAFLRHLKELYGDKKPFTIINSFAITSGIVTNVSKHGADYFMLKPLPYSEICNTINDLLDTTSLPCEPKHVTTDNNLDIKITHFLHCMGVPAHLNGYNYIRSSLKLAIDDITTLDPITRKLYPMIAKKYNKSPQSIERSIRHAIKVSWDRGNKKVIYDVFGISPESSYHGCPTNSEYIAMLADDLKLRLKHNIAI